MAPQRRANKEQMRILLDSLEENKEFLTSGCNLSPVARNKINQFWENIAAALNEVEYGCKKTSTGWRNYWSEIKYRIRKHMNNYIKRLESGLLARVSISEEDTRVMRMIGFISEEDTQRRVDAVPSTSTLKEQPVHLKMIKIKVDPKKDDTIKDTLEIWEDNCDEVESNDCEDFAINHGNLEKLPNLHPRPMKERSPPLLKQSVSSESPRNSSEPYPRPPAQELYNWARELEEKRYEQEKINTRILARVEERVGLALEELVGLVRTYVDKHS